MRINYRRYFGKYAQCQRDVSGINIDDDGRVRWTTLFKERVRQEYAFYGDPSVNELSIIIFLLFSNKHCVSITMIKEYICKVKI